MIPAGFEYERADSLEQAVTLLAEHGDEAKLLAGGHSLLPLMKLRLATPALLVDVGRLDELRFVRDEGEAIAVGALTSHHDLSRNGLLRRQLPALAHVAGQIGDPQVRHRGTIGGSLAHGDPAADLPALVLALGGTMVATGPRGRREIPASEFHLGFLETVLEPDEVLVEVRLPKDRSGAAGFGFEKLTKRAQDWAIVAAVAVRRDDTPGGAGVALVNMAAVPVRAASVEAALAEGASVAEAAELADADADPPADVNGSVEYRRHLARVLVRRALTTAFGGDGPGGSNGKGVDS
ncbi:MAG TPA: xanthine dehydrogenase family protein subunit M [Acidimicrobiales bacterium]|nr:xanthine dehydrogenase family protein subunit M [Acidimicrobiales bacterium]